MPSQSASSPSSSSSPSSFSNAAPLPLSALSQPQQHLQHLLSCDSVSDSLHSNALRLALSEQRDLVRAESAELESSRALHSSLLSRIFCAEELLEQRKQRISQLYRQRDALGVQHAAENEIYVKKIEYLTKKVEEKRRQQEETRKKQQQEELEQLRQHIQFYHQFLIEWRVDRQRLRHEYVTDLSEKLQRLQKNFLQHFHYFSSDFFRSFVEKKLELHSAYQAEKNRISNSFDEKLTAPLQQNFERQNEYLKLHFEKSRKPIEQFLEILKKIHSAERQKVEKQLKKFENCESEKQKQFKRLQLKQKKAENLVKKLGTKERFRAHILNDMNAHVLMANDELIRLEVQRGMMQEKIEEITNERNLLTAIGTEVKEYFAAHRQTLEKQVNSQRQAIAAAAAAATTHAQTQNADDITADTMSSATVNPTERGTSVAATDKRV